MSHFNEVANEWDSESKVKMMQTLAQKVRANTQLEKNLKIMDFGCGTGLFGLEFADLATELIGIDTSAPMLEVFKKKTNGDARFAFKNINLEEKDLNMRFDLIISSMAFHHLNKPKAVLAKFKDNLNKNGKVIIVDLDKEDGSFHPDNEAMGVKHFGFAKETLQSWAGELGLQLEHKIINDIEKEGKSFHQFCAIYSI